MMVHGWRQQVLCLSQMAEWPGLSLCWKHQKSGDEKALSQCLDETDWQGSQKKYTSSLGDPLAGPLRVSVLHLTTLGTQAIHFSHGEPHYGSISKNAVVFSRPLEHAGFLNSGHTWPRHVDKNSPVSKHIVSILSNKNCLQRIPFVATISKKPLKYK